MAMMFNLQFQRLESTGSWLAWVINRSGDTFRVHDHPVQSMAA